MATDFPIPLPSYLQSADGEIRLVGHRISIVDLLHFYREGFSAEMLAVRFGMLSLAEIHYVLGFYHEHQDAMDSYLDAYLADCRRNRQEAQPEQQKLRQRLIALRAAQRKAAHAS